MLKGWRTILFNVAAAIFGVLETVDWINVIPYGWAGMLVPIVSVVNIYLRAQTNTPIGRKE